MAWSPCGVCGCIGRLAQLENAVFLFSSNFPRANYSSQAYIFSSTAERDNRKRETPILNKDRGETR